MNIILQTMAEEHRCLRMICFLPRMHKWYDVFTGNRWQQTFEIWKRERWGTHISWQKESYLMNCWFYRAISLFLP